MTRIPLTGGEALDVAAKLAPALAAGAGERDRTRRLPHTEIDELSASGLLAVTVPAEFGGPELGPGVVAGILSILAAADPSVAQIPHSHFVFLDALRRNGSVELQRSIFKQVIDGARIANAQTERRSRTVAEDAATVRTADDDGTLRLDGVKYYCTGSVFAHLLAVRAVDATATREDASGTARSVVVYLPADRPGITVTDDWDGLGQRTTASGTVTFDDVHVEPGEIVDYTALFDGPGTYGARAQLFHAAIDAGIARGALEAGADAAANARPWTEAGVDRAVDDPLLIVQAGELELTVRAAEALLERAAAAIDAAERVTTDDAAGAPAAIAEASLA
ncbi:MAG: acyl-CoA dehydrogenase family protein, partial [Gordonia sp. (in: high G+C Gram-positive bacteria)]